MKMSQPSTHNGANMILTMSTAIYLTCAGLVLGQTTGITDHDPFKGADKIFHYTFGDEQDKEFDHRPDDWTRRKGPEFPTYVETLIDRTHGHTDKRSLRFNVNGGKAIYYSKLEKIDASHSFVFEGHIRTHLLKHDAALLSVSFLNHKRQRVQRFLTRPVTGSHSKWVRVRIGPVAPHKDVRFVVIGCHLAHSKKMDIRGSVWFDDLWLGRLPQLTLVSNFNVHFKQPNAPIVITTNVSGLDPGPNYVLHLQLLDSNNTAMRNERFSLTADVKPENDKQPDQQPAKRKPMEWRLTEKHGYGFYRVRSRLIRDGEVILDQQTSFSVLDLVEPASIGEFGWSIAHDEDSVPIKELATIAAQAGINWLKYPLWQSTYTGNQARSNAIAKMLEDLQRRGITPIGLLNEPPPNLRRKFAKNWAGISEIFTMPESFWSASMDRVIARYSSNVRHWQLGGETDSSFVGMSHLGETIANVKHAFDRIGRDTQIGLHWDWETPLPPRAGMPRSFFSLSRRQQAPRDGEQPDPQKPQKRLTALEFLKQKLEESKDTGLPRWVMLKPLAKSKYSQEQRGADLVKSMVAAKIGGADAIFASDIFDEEHGLLNPNGSPTLLFLPWRSTALALQGAEYLGSFNLPQGSVNHAFARDSTDRKQREKEVVLIVWNSEKVIEELYLGEKDKVTITDVWGRKVQAPRRKGTTRQMIEVGPVPLIIRGCSEPVARWRMAVRFKKGRLRSETTEQSEWILGINTFPQSISGKIILNLPDEWKVEARGGWSLPGGLATEEEFSLKLGLWLPSNASLGTDELSIDFEIDADQRYNFRVYRPYRIGLGDVALQVVDSQDEDGHLIIEQIIINNTSPLEILDFDCSLYVPDHKRQRIKIFGIRNGQHRWRYTVPNADGVRSADALRNKELWLSAKQTNGRRVLNYKWPVGQYWDKKKEVGRDSKPDTNSKGPLNDPRRKPPPSRQPRATSR